MKIFFLTFILLFLPMIVFGQDDPNRGAGGLVPCSGTTCSACNFVQLANLLIDWLIGIITLLFAVLMMVAGFRLVTSGGNPSAKEAAKKSFTNAIIGFIIVLAAWVAVDTIMRTLLGEDGTVNGNLPWNEIQCATQTETKIAAYNIEVDFPEFEAGGGDHVHTGSGSNCPAAPESTVVPIPSEMLIGGPEKIKPEILRNFISMREAALEDGINLKIVDGWRPEEEQVILFNRFCPSGTCGRTVAARPCSMGGNGSNHNSGVALDISVGCGNGTSGCNTATYIWLKNNGSAYGFRNNLPTDPPHWSPTGR